MFTTCVLRRLWFVRLRCIDVIHEYIGVYPGSGDQYKLTGAFSVKCHALICSRTLWGWKNESTASTYAVYVALASISTLMLLLLSRVCEHAHGVNSLGVWSKHGNGALFATKERTGGVVSVEPRHNFLRHRLAKRAKPPTNAHSTAQLGQTQRNRPPGCQLDEQSQPVDC